MNILVKYFLLKVQVQCLHTIVAELMLISVAGLTYFEE